MSEYYGWIDDVESVAITFVHGLALHEIGEALNFQWPTERRVTFTEAEEQRAETYFETGILAPLVQVGQIDDWIVAVEPDGILSSFKDVLTALSRNDMAVSVKWGVNGHERFTAARRGAVVRRFDALLYRSGADGEPLPEERGLPFGEPGHPLRHYMMELAERLTGVSVDRDWFVQHARRTWDADYPSGPRR